MKIEITQVGVSLAASIMESYRRNLFAVKLSKIIITYALYKTQKRQ